MKKPEFNHRLAEFVGILLGDGCISVYEKHHRLQITLHSEDDVKYADYVSKMIHGLFDVEPKIKYRKNENTLDVHVFKRDLIRFLIEEVGLKPSPKWNTAEIPEWIVKDFGKDVLRGYADTDGSVVITNNNGIRYPRIEMKICPSPMQNQFIQILKDLDFRFGVYQIGKGQIRIQINGKNELKKWVDKVGFANQRKLDRANSFF